MRFVYCMWQSPEESGLGGLTGPDTLERVRVEEKGSGGMGLVGSGELLGQGVKPGQRIGKA